MILFTELVAKKMHFGTFRYEPLIYQTTSRNIESRASENGEIHYAVAEVMNTF